MTTSGNGTGHFKPGVISIPPADDAESLIGTAAKLLAAENSEARRAVARQYVYAVQGATVIDGEQRSTAVSVVNDRDATYRNALVHHQHAQQRREQSRSEADDAAAKLEQFLTAIHGIDDAESDKPSPAARSRQTPDDVHPPDVSAEGWMRAISRIHVALPFSAYAGILAASVALGFLVDKGSFNALQLAQKTLGFSTTDGLAFAFAVLVPALGHLAGLMVWWRLDPDAGSSRRRRAAILLIPALIAAAFLVMAIVMLRVAYLRHTGASVSIWPLMGISVAVLFVDLCASTLRHNPWPIRRTELEDDVTDKKETAGNDDELLAEAETAVMTAQGELAKAIEKLLDPYFVHFADKAPLIEMLRGEETAKAFTANEALIYPPQDGARLRWIKEYTESCPSPFIPKGVEGGIVQRGAEDEDEDGAEDEDEDEDTADFGPEQGGGTDDASISVRDRLDDPLGPNQVAR